MKGIQALREQRSTLAKNARDYLESNNENWSPVNNDHYDSVIAQIDDIDNQILRITAVQEREAKELIDNQVNDAASRHDRSNSQPSKLFAKWLRGGDNALNSEEWSVVRNTMSTGEGAEGGFTVQKEVAKTISEALKAYGGMRSVATVYQTETGNQIDWPTTDGTGEEGEQIGENTEVDDLDPEFGTVPMATYMFSSKGVAVPIALLTDSAIDLELFIRNRLVTRIGRITNKRFTVGTGVNQPRGAVTASLAGKVGVTGQTATVTYDDLVDLQHSVNREYRKLSPAFMMADTTVRTIRKIKDTQGRPIFVPGYEMTVPGGVPDTLLGDRLVINDDVPAMAAGAKSIIYGDFSPYIIRDVMAYTLFRMTDSAYSRKGQVGFLMLSRHAGNYIDVGGGLKHYQNSAT